MRNEITFAAWMPKPPKDVQDARKALDAAHAAYEARMDEVDAEVAKIVAEKAKTGEDQRWLKESERTFVESRTADARRQVTLAERHLERVLAAMHPDTWPSQLADALDETAAEIHKRVEELGELFARFATLRDNLDEFERVPQSARGLKVYAKNSTRAVNSITDVTPSGALRFLGDLVADAKPRARALRVARSYADKRATAARVEALENAKTYAEILAAVAPSTRTEDESRPARVGAW